MTKQKKLLLKIKHTITSFLPSYIYSNKQDIIVFSHHRWEHTHRQQHIFTRLAKQRRILFIEEPIHFHPFERGKAVISHPQKNIIVLQPKILVKDLTKDLPLIIAKQIRAEKLHDPILWFNSATCSEIIPFLNHSLIVYEFMDKQQFRQGYNSSELALFSVADITFSNEKMLYDEMPKNMRNLYYLQTKAKSLSEHDWNDIVAQMQKIIHRVLRAKTNTSRRFIPSYYPFIPRLTTNG